MKKMTPDNEKVAYGKAFNRAISMTEAMDDRMDKKAGIKENSKADIALDKKRGVPAEMPMPKSKKG